MRELDWDGWPNGLMADSGYSGLLSIEVLKSCMMMIMYHMRHITDATTIVSPVKYSHQVCTLFAIYRSAYRKREGYVTHHSVIHVQISILTSKQMLCADLTMN